MQQIPVHEFLTIEERKALMQKDDRRAALEVLHTWAWIAGAFALVYFFPNVLTIVVALFILGGKQLACAIIMHDTSHRSMFTNPRANDWVGKWLGAYPIFNDMLKYRPYHLEHHLHTGTEQDPDLNLTTNYPTTPGSMFRKVLRDLAGPTGIKGQAGLILMQLGYLRYNLGNKVEKLDQSQRSSGEIWQAFRQNLGGPLLANGVMLATFALLGAPELYLLWPGALLTTFNFSSRIRSIAEHSLPEDPQDPLKNTRTTYANWLERLLFAPHHVNYHLEHHMLMTVPSYNLPRMHRLLLDKGFYRQHGLLEPNYWRILRRAAGLEPNPV